MAAFVDDDEVLDRRSLTPLYAQLKKRLLRRLARGDYVPGGAFPTQRELVEGYGVSAITARRVLDELARDGLIERRNGVGTFVRVEPRRKRLTLLILEYQEPRRRQIASAFGELVGGIAEVAWEERAALTLAYVRQPDEFALWLEEAQESHAVDGVLLRPAGDISADYLEQLERARLPYVLVRRRVPGRSAPCALVDDRAAVRLATAHMIDLGHRRIGFAASTQSPLQYGDRLDGYREALVAADYRFDEQLVVPTPDFSPESGAAAALALLRRSPAPSALVMGSDSMAIGAYEAVARCGLRIPQDVSIAGVADIPEAQVLRPALTTVRTSYVELGARATRLLLAGIEATWRGDPLPAQVDVIEPRLVVRESTAPPHQEAPSPK